MQSNVCLNGESAANDPGIHERQLKETISKQMQDYQTYCANVSKETWLNDNGTLSNNAGNTAFQKELLTLLKYKDPKCVAKHFDNLRWWKVEGAIRFEELSVLACMFLGKPSHNGFQERVFSRGTYVDGKLRKRLKEENFEMSVLNSFNITTVQNIRQTMQDTQAKKVLGWMSHKVTSKAIATEILNFYKRNFEENDGTVQLKSKPSDVTDDKLFQDNDNNDSKTQTDNNDIDCDDESIGNYLTSDFFWRDEKQK